TAPVEIPTPVESRVVPAPPVTAPVEKPAPVETQALPAPPPAAPTEQSPVETKALPAAPVSAPVVSSPIESRAIPSQPPIERKETAPSTTPPDASKVDSTTTPKAEQPSFNYPRTDSPFRAPPAGSSPFRTPRDAPPASDYDPTKPSVDLDAAKKRAAEIAKEGAGQRALFAMPLPKPKNKMEEAIEKARKPDCRTAYQNLGLLAIVPLVANEFGEGSCRW
ncbi:MAG TPA: hypothetical protein VFU92_09135, partial [Usitatibacter sp.]|nr:hypothetical protein [Usitatibacter sp.]